MGNILHDVALWLVGVLSGFVLFYGTTIESSKPITPSKVNGKVPIKKMYDDNSDEPSDIFV